jgi:hypothetical protein
VIVGFGYYGQPDPSDELRKSSFGAQLFPQRIDIQMNKRSFPIFIRAFEARERTITVARFAIAGCEYGKWQAASTIRGH